MKTVLVIEDDLSIREALRTILENEGYDAHVACNGREGLEVLEHLRTDVVLLDLTMPVMNGFEFRMRQLENPKIASIPTIVLTADRSFFLSSPQLGLTRSLKKPIDLDELLNLLETV